METHLKIAGIIQILLACIHIGFPKKFNWKIELAALSLINRQMMEVHTFFIGFVVLLMGFLCLFCSEDMIKTELGNVVSLGLFVFWFVRLVFQFFIYSRSLWKGKKFETTMHIVFSAIWFYLSAVFFLAWQIDPMA